MVDSKGRQVAVSGQELCQFPAVVEDKTGTERGLVGHSVISGIKKRKRSKTVLETIASSTKVRYNQKLVR